MNKHKYQNSALIEKIVIALILPAILYILQNFIRDLVWAGIVAVLVYPLFLRISTKLGQGLGALISLLLFSISIAFPAIITLNILSGELIDLVHHLTNLNKTGVAPPPYLVKIPFLGATLLDWWQMNLSTPGGLFKVLKGFALTQDVANFLKNVTSYIAADILHVVISFISCWVLLSSHESVKASIYRILDWVIPNYANVFATKVPTMLKATAFGLGSVALLEGVVLGFAYYLAGAPFPLLLGIVTAYLALIPGGAPFSFSTVSLIVLTQGNAFNAGLLFAWGALELFMVDKFIRPKLIGKEVGLPFLAVLLALLGGVSTLGIIGLFVGPALMAIVFSVFGLNSASTE